MIEETINHSNLQHLIPYLTYHKDHNYGKFGHRKSILLTLHHESTLSEKVQKHLTPEKLEFLKTGDNLLIIDMSLEGRYKVVELIYNILVLSLKIPENNILLVCCSPDYIQEIYNVSKYKFKKPINCEVYYYFERRMKDIIEEEKFIPNTAIEKEKLYLNFNRLLRSHRLFLMDLLRKNELLNEGFNSLGDLSAIDYTIDRLFYDTKKKYKTFNSTSVKSLIPMTIDTEDFSKNLALVTLHSIKKYYEKSALSLVTETNYNYNSPRFLTEKTFKPIANKQPFILISVPYTLELLREIGYRTFDGIIDESYDKILNDEDRLIAIKEEILRLNKTYSYKEIVYKCREITEYNYNLLVSKY